MQLKARGRRIYLDHAATTPIDPRVKTAMAPYLGSEFGNPGGLYREGVRAKRAVEGARKRIAGLLNARVHELIFTGSGTEANNLALMGYAEALRGGGRAWESMRFVTSVIEHSSVLGVMRELERRGARVTYVGVTDEGVLKLDEFKRAIADGADLVSLMYANNEIGTIQPLFEIRKEIRNFKNRNQKPTIIHRTSPIFHIDACNAPSYLDVRADKLGADLVSFDAHKMYGPKGIGMLYARRGTKLHPRIFGGGQEHGMRAGTENVSALVGLAEALEIAIAGRERESKRQAALRDFFIGAVLKNIPQARLNGNLHDRLPNNAHFSFPGHDNEWLALQLDAAGIAVGTKSACLSNEERGESYVVRALGKDAAYAASTLRFTLGTATTKAHLVHTVRALARALLSSK